LFDKEHGTDVMKPYWGGKSNEHLLGIANGTIKEKEKK